MEERRKIKRVKNEGETNKGRDRGRKDGMRGKEKMEKKKSTKKRLGEK